MKLYKDASEIIATQVSEVGLPKEIIPVLDRLTHHRRGWVKRGVNEEGTIEDAKQHVAKLALAAASIDGQRWGISNIRLRTQALIHELPEILGVDWTPGEISEVEKFKQEEAHLEELLPLEFPKRAEIIEHWLDFEKDKGLAYFLDKMDAVITAEYYALTNPAYLQVADEFFTYGHEKVQDKILRRVLEDIKLHSKGNKSTIQLTPENIFPTYFKLLSNC